MMFNVGDRVRCKLDTHGKETYRRTNSKVVCEVMAVSGDNIRVRVDGKTTVYTVWGPHFELEQPLSFENK